MFSYEEISDEEVEKIIEKVAEKIHQYRMEVPAILLLETSKPVSFIGAQLGRVYLSPFLPLLKEDLNIPVEKILRIFEDRENLEKLIKLIEEKAKKEEEW